MNRKKSLQRSALLAAMLGSFPSYAQDCVVLIHGLARTSASMDDVATALSAEGYHVANIDYPSRQHPIETLAPLAVNAGIKACPNVGRIHFVTHSLGGILIRYYLEKWPIPRLGNVVMLAPPNQGSEVVDTYRNVPGYALINGPAGLQLGTDEHSIPSQLGPVAFPLGVIAGNKTFNPILSLSLPNPDDGKVSVARTKVTGMADFVVVPHTHTFMMQAEVVIKYTINFLVTSCFLPSEYSTRLNLRE